MRTVTVSWQPYQDRFEARGTHPVTIPINAPHGDGPATGFSATELLLAGAGSCSTWDIVEIMRKAREDLTGLEVEVVGEQAISEPWQYDRLSLRYTFRGRGISRQRAERAVALSVDKYCSVLATIRGVAKIETEVIVIDEPTDEAATVDEPETAGDERETATDRPAADDDLPPGLPDRA